MRRKLFFSIVVGVIVSMLVGFFAGQATQSSVNTWYATLEKPFFNPPNWIFAPVWTLLYLLMGIAVGRVWNYGIHHRWVKTAIYHYGFQLLVNGLWSLVFWTEVSHWRYGGDSRTAIFDCKNYTTIQNH